MKAPSLRVDGVTVRVGRATLLDGVSLDVEPGRFVAVVGPNGAGKTTLLRCLDRLVRPTSGAVFIEGRRASSMPRRELARIVSYVPQSPARSEDYSVRDYVELARFPHLGAWGAPGAEDHQAVADALEQTETAHLADRRLASLSGGEFQRTLIAAALAQGGRILLLDEPTSFLDFRHQVQVVALLERLHRKGRLTIVAVTHDLNTTARAAQEVVALKDGRVAFHGDPASLLHEGVLESIFDTPFRRVPVAAGEGVFVLPSEVS